MSVNINLKEKIYDLKYNLLFNYAYKRGLIRTYNEDDIEKFRKVNYGGVPASILLLFLRSCKGHCYDRALLLSYAFEKDDYVMMDADIDGIKYYCIDEVKKLKKQGIQPSEHYANHCFIIKKGDDTREWVYDTTQGLVYEKNIYFMMERPKVTRINGKNDVTSYIEYIDLKKQNDNFEAAPLLLEMIEEQISPKTAGFYYERLLEEIKLFKENIDYDELIRYRNFERYSK